MTRVVRALVALLLIGAAPPAPDLHVDAEAAEAVLALLDDQAAGRGIGRPGWSRLLAARGYRRLKTREAAMGRAFTDADFRAFVADPALIARRHELRAALGRWRTADIGDARARAAAYLPPGAPIRATIFPIIKPRPNSFVFDTRGDPAIFLSLDPAVTPAQLANTVAHELHHIGYAAACADASPDLPPARAAVAQWTGAFGEGLAMLAAAGGPDTHPHATSPDADRARWDRDMARYDADVARLTGFFTAILEGRLTGEALNRAGMDFFGIQGPWYTVGWRMAHLIETRFGRAALVGTLCNRRDFLILYNRAAASRTLPLWPQAILDALRPER
jgi:hypothetical protein